MKKILQFHLPVLAAIFIFFVFCSFNNLTPVWTSGSNIIKPVRAGNTASYSNGNNGWLFIVSGRDQNDAITKTVQRYNAGANTWDTLNPHPTGLIGSATAVLKDSLYIIGGVISPPGSGQTTVYKFSINENTWTTAANFPVPIVDAKAVSYQDSLIYTAGGFGGANTGNIYLYNSNSNSWRTATPFPSAGRRNFGGFAVTGDTLVYMCGTTAFGTTVYFDSVYVGVISQSNRAVINWTRGANVPGKTRTFFDANSWGNKGIIMTGGSTDNTFNTPERECYSFSPGRNEWTQLPDKPTEWLTGQSGSVKLANNIWKLICASGYDSAYLSNTEILTDTLITVGVNNINSQLPEKFILSQNYPNPFNPETIINYKIPTGSHRSDVKLIVYNNLGHEVKTLLNEKQKAGSYSVKFDGTNFSSGIYYYSIFLEGVTETKKMLLIK